MAQQTATYRLGSIVTDGTAPGMQYPRYLVDTDGEHVGYIDEVAGMPAEISAQEVADYIERGDAYMIPQDDEWADWEPYQ